MPPSLCERLRDHTRDLHRAAERAPFMARLLAGRLDRAGYVAFLAQLQPIYTALESELDRSAHHPALATLRLPGLFRSAALAADLAVLARFHGPKPSVEPVAAAYAQRLRELGRSHPERLLAHAYVRYLGDLGGGQILRKVVARSIGPATRFYAFGGAATDTDAVGAAKTLATRLRRALDSAPLDAAQARAVIDEAGLAFERHLELFARLAARRAENTDCEAAAAARRLLP